MASSSFLEKKGRKEEKEESRTERYVGENGKKDSEVRWSFPPT